MKHIQGMGRWSILKNAPIIISILLCFSLPAWSQVITHGPIVGAVTSESARILVRTDAQAVVSFELDTDSGFINPIFTEPKIAEPELDYFAIIDVDGLLPDTQYYYRVVIDDLPQQETCQFMTFPPPGTATDFTFAFGSCQQADGDENSHIGGVFPLIAQDEPRFFLNLGDWGYPDITHQMAGLPGRFNENFSRVQDSYRTKYDPAYPMSELFKIAPIDYVYDDHDYSADNTDMTAPARENSLQGYDEMFPHYPLPNGSNGLWHKFTFGNADFFVLDTRTQRHPNMLAFQEAEDGTLAFQPGPEHLILQGDPDISGELQMDWLIRELQESTATWKFICSTIAFNPGHRAALKLLLSFQDMPEASSDELLGPIANALSDGWSGFPASTHRLVRAVHEANIQNVIVLSGDSHTAAIDDGANSLFPEFMAGGLDRSNSMVVAFMEIFGIYVWNQGGQTMEQDNFNSHYGRVKVSGDNSVTFEIVDEFGELIASYTQEAGHLVSTSAMVAVPAILEYYMAPVGGIDSQPLSLVNTGLDPVEVSSIDISDSSFKLPSDVQLLFTILPGESIDLDIVFQPEMPGKHNASMTIQSSDPDSPFIIPLTGTGTGESVSSFTMSLPPGLNMISLPLKPVVPYTARSFAEELSATIIIEFDAVNQRYVGFSELTPGDGVTIQGGKGYIVNVPNGGTFTFTGTVWKNAPSIETAPPIIPEQSAWAFVVNGFLTDIANAGGNYAVIIRNVSKDKTIIGTVEASGYFSTAWADPSRNPVVENGDEVEITVVDGHGRVVSGPHINKVKPESIRNALINVQLRLGHVIPEKSALLQNYPNPFNPETWIPYKLSEGSEVIMRIYSSAGQLIRTMDLGHKEAGSYVTRDSAIHWNGMTDSGERVASGAYFYSIKAGEYSANRKMIVAQ